MPAQHGDTSVLARMNRGYTREAYIELAERVRCVFSIASHASCMENFRIHLGVQVDDPRCRNL
jgi:hypothetical protein